MHYKMYILLMSLCFMTSIIYGQQTKCEEVNKYSEQDYKKHIAERNNIIDDLFDIDLKLAIDKIDHTLKNCLKKSDFCNEGSLVCKKALAYTFLGENDIAKKLLVDAEKYKKSCISPSYIGYNISRTAYFIAVNKKIEVDIIKALNETIYYAKEMNDTVRLAYAYANQGSYYLSSNRYNSGIESSIQAMNLMKTKNQPDFIFGIYGNLAHLHWGLHNYEKVIEMCDKALQIEHENEGTNAATVYGAKGQALLKLGHSNRAKEAFLKALELNEKLGSTEGKSISYNWLGDCFHQLGRHKDAINYYEKALEIYLNTKDYTKSIKCYRLIGNVYFSMDSMSKADEYYNLADKMIAEQKLENKIELVSNVKVKLYLKMNNPKLYEELIKSESVEDSLHKNYQTILNLDLIEKYQSDIKETENQKLQLQQAILNQKMLQNDIERIALINKNQKLTIANFTATEHRLEMEAARKLLAMENKALSASEQLNKAEKSALLTEQKMKEVTISKQRSLLFASILGLSLISLLTFALYRQTRKRKKINNQLALQKDQIQLLHQELNHRVKNNLSFMTSLVEMQGRRTQNIEARQILQETENRLAALSLVHSNLFHNDETSTVNLANYLTELVIQLEKIFAIPDKDLSIKTDFIDYHVNADDAMRLGLIVNELITNSVKHAFIDVNNPQIKITTSKDKTGKLKLEYKDNGPGHSHVSNLSSEESNSHLGTKLIALLREQMKDRYTVIC